MSTTKTSPSPARSYPEPGSLARWDGVGDTRAEEALAALPPKAKALLDAMQASGWRWSVVWSVDTGDNAFVGIRGGARPEVQVNATWHTRGTGTLRMFGLLVRGGTVHGRGWCDASLRTAMSLVERNPAS